MTVTDQPALPLQFNDDALLALLCDTRRELAAVKKRSDRDIADLGKHYPTGLPVVKLSNGRAGGGRWCYVHLLLAATFGEAAPANIHPTPANSNKLDSTMQPLQQTPANSNGWSPRPLSPPIHAL
jgi:hypothetical protein